MVNDAETFGIDPAGGHPERALALSYAPPHARGAVAALFALDQILARLALGTRDAMVAQLRLAWWDEALRAPRGEVPAQPVLRALAAAGLADARVAAIVDAWQRVLGEEAAIDLTTFANERGGLFALAAGAMDASDDVTAAGQGWALATLAVASASPALGTRARALAAPLLASAAAQRWSREGRALGALVHVARADLAAAYPPAAPRRIARLAWHRLTGR